MKKLFIGNLSEDTNEKELCEVFAQFGTVRSSKLVKDVFSGKCKGFGFIEMEGHEARAARAELNGKELNGRPMKVDFEERKPGRGRNRRSY